MVNKSMDNDSSTPKLSIKENTPKTGGGISKSLLTPCRRVGLSRNRKSTPTGLTTPLSTPNSTNIYTNKTEDDIDSTPKLKKAKVSKLCNENTQFPIRNKLTSIRNLRKNDSEEFCNETSSVRQSTDIVNINNDTAYINKTKCEERIPKTSQNNVMEEDKLSELKNSETIAIGKIAISPARECKVIIAKMKSNERICETAKRFIQSLDEEKTSDFENEDLVPLKRLKRGINNLKKSSSTKNDPKLEEKEYQNMAPKVERNNVGNILLVNDNKSIECNEINLTKKCMKVIEKQILNNSESCIEISDSTDEDFDFRNKNVKEMSKLSSLKTNKEKKTNEKDLQSQDKKVIKDKKDSLKVLQTKKSSKEKPLNRSLSALKLSQTSQNSTSSCTEDDDDFEFNTKKTILIRKTYNKNKPHLVRAKTTGSITEKDIEVIKRRIESKKKKIFEAESIEKKTFDELKIAIEKWRVGCQQALNELLEIMKKNVPDKENMDIEVLLKTWNIPVGLVKYNTEECCFE